LQNDADNYGYIMSSILSSVTNLIVHTISTLGYPGVGLLMAIQTVAIPVPSEVIIPFAGFLVSVGRFNIFIIAIVGAIGSCVGASAAYYIGFKGGRPLIERYGKYVFISHRDLNFTEKFFAQFGFMAVFIGQLLPIVRSFIGFFAGVAEENFKKFIASVFTGSFLWCLLLGFIGMKLGQHWTDLHTKFQKFDGVVAVLILLAAAYWIYRHIKHHIPSKEKK